MPQSPLEIEVLTPPGRGAVAVISCTGDMALLDGATGSLPLCVARDGRLFRDRSINRITFARWGLDHPEDVVVCRTSENKFEVHCHGGRAAVERIRQELLDAIGSESTSLEHRDSTEHQQLLSAAWDAVSRATTLRTADLLLHQAAEAWPAALGSPSQTSASGRREPADGIRWAEFGQHLTDPWLVALVGQPNAGKSSLMNALAGFQRSIVNPTPGTTRDAVTLDVAFDGWPVRLVDTAGLREGADELEAAGIERARRVISHANLVLQVFDATETQPAIMDRAIPVANKIDLLPDTQWPEEIIPVSALTGSGIERLIERIVAHLIPELPPRGLAIPVSQEHLDWLVKRSLTSDL